MTSQNFATTLAAVSEDETAQWRAFGEWLNDRIDRLGRPKSEVAALAGMSPSYLATLRSGGRMYRGTFMLPSPSDRKLMQLATAIREPVSEVFNRAGRAVPRWVEEDVNQAQTLAEVAEWADAQLDASRAQLEVVGLEERLSTLSPAARRRVVSKLIEIFAEEERR